MVKFIKSVGFLVATGLGISTFLVLMMNNVLINSVDVVHYIINNPTKSIVSIGIFVIVTSILLFINFVENIRARHKAKKVKVKGRLIALRNAIALSYLVCLLVANEVIQKHDQVYKSYVALIKSDVCSAFNNPVGRQPIDIVISGGLKNKAFESFAFKNGYYALNAILNESPILGEKTIEMRRMSLNEHIEKGCNDLRKSQFS